MSNNWEMTALPLNHSHPCIVALYKIQLIYCIKFKFLLSVCPSWKYALFDLSQVQAMGFMIDKQFYVQVWSVHLLLHGLEFVTFASLNALHLEI